MKALLTAERLRTLYLYDELTGAFIRRIATGALKQGRSSTYVANNGYLVVGVDYRSYAAHRLAWLYVNGEWPIDEIDHINGDRADNRIANLRSVSRSINAQNRRQPLRNNKTGFLGVTKYKGRYRATICVNRRCILIGLYDTPEQASAAYLTAKRAHHEGNTL